MRHCKRMRRRLGELISVCFICIQLAGLSSAHIPVKDDLRIEPTPVLVPGPSSSHIMSFISVPLEGSNGHPGYEFEMQETPEGSGLARTKRDYSLEDFLVWMNSGDGSTEEWQHRPRDTSWMKRGFTTTTVYVTTTVYTTVVPIPFTPSTIKESTLYPPVFIQPATVTPIVAPPTKLPESSIPEVGNSVHTPSDKGGGKNLDNSLESASVTTNMPSAKVNSSSTDAERPQSDYASTSNSGNKLPGSPTSKEKTTKHPARTNYITVTKTVTSPPTTVYAGRPPIVTTTSSSSDSQYELTDLVHSSLEYPGPSATITIPSAVPTIMHSTKTLYSTSTFTSTSTLQPTPETVVEIPMHTIIPTTSYMFIPITPSAVVSEETNPRSSESGEEPEINIPSSTTSLANHDLSGTTNDAITTPGSPYLEESLETTEASDKYKFSSEASPIFIVTDESKDDSQTTDWTFTTQAERHTMVINDSHTPVSSVTAAYDSMIPINSNDTVYSTTVKGIPFDTTVSPSEEDNLTIDNPMSEETVVSESSISGYETSYHSTDEIDAIITTEASSFAKEITTLSSTSSFEDESILTLIPNTSLEDKSTRSDAAITAEQSYGDSTTEVSSDEITNSFFVFIQSTQSPLATGTITMTPTFMQAGTNTFVTDMSESSGESNGSSDTDSGETSATTVSYSNIPASSYTTFVPNSMTLIPQDATKTTDAPLTISTTNVDVVDPTPGNNEADDDTEYKEITDYYSTIRPDVILETTTTHLENDDDTMIGIGVTDEYSTIPSSMTIDPLHLTESSLFPFTPDIYESTLGTNYTSMNESDLDYVDQEGVNETLITKDYNLERTSGETAIPEMTTEFSITPISITTDSNSTDTINQTIQLTPTETTKSLSSSGIEASLSVILLPDNSEHTTYPIEVTTPIYNYDTGDNSTENSTNLFGSLQPSPVSSTILHTGDQNTSSFTSSPYHPTLQPSHDPLGESDTNLSSSTTSLPSDVNTHFQSHQSDTVTIEKVNVTDLQNNTTNFPDDLESTSFQVSEIDKGLPSDSMTNTTDPIFSTTSTTSEVSISLTLLTTVSPVISSTASTKNVSEGSSSSTTEIPVTSTTQKSPITFTSGSTISRLTTDLTTGAQPSPPSPSNNSTVPLDQRYWVRTILEGSPKEEDPVKYYANMQDKLTEIYKVAYNRNSGVLKYKSTANESDISESMNSSTFDSTTTELTTLFPITVTSNPYENYTTIIGRRKRETSDSKHPFLNYYGENAESHQELPFRRYKKTMLAFLKNKENVKLVNHTRYSHYTSKASNYIRRKRKAKKTYDDFRNPFITSRILLTSQAYPLNVPSTSKHPNQHNTAPKRLKRSAPNDISVRLHNVTHDNATDQTELIYTVFDGEWPILAKEAVGNMSVIDDMEMAVSLDQVVLVKAEEYLSTGSAGVNTANVYVIIGGVVGGVMFLVFVLWCTVFLYKRKARAEEVLQPDSPDASPRSHLSTNAYMGRVNLAYSDGRDEKVRAMPLPSTSRPTEGDLGRASPSGSHEHLIRPKQGPSFGTSGKSGDPFYRKGSTGDREGRSSSRTSREGSSRGEDDYPSTEEEDDEATTLRRPKSGVPWKRGHRAIMDEPVYSSPKPISFQDPIIPSTMSRYETTHSEMSSSDPTHQLMANMIQGAHLFTSKDQGSLFLPPPLLPPPHGFGKAQESPFIPGTSLPRFLPPPRPVKQINLGNSPDGTSYKISSQIDAYSYDPEAPPIPPRNYTREEAGLPPLGEGTSPTRPPMRDAQVEARIESETAGSSASGEGRKRSMSGSSSHLSDSGGSEGSLPNVGRLRRRFHDLLDDAFSLLSGQRPGDKVTPLTTPTSGRKIRAKSAAVQQRGRPSDVFEEEGHESTGRPWSAAAVQSTAAWKEAQAIVGVIPLDQSRSPRSAWGDMGRPGTSFGRPSSVPAGASRPASVHALAGRPSSGPSGTGRPGSSRSCRSITPVNMPPSSPDEIDGRRSLSAITSVHSRSNDPIDPDTGLRTSDPAVPLIKAIKEELKRFKTTVSTDTSNA